MGCIYERRFQHQKSDISRTTIGQHHAGEQENK